MYTEFLPSLGGQVRGPGRPRRRQRSSVYLVTLGPVKRVTGYQVFIDHGLSPAREWPGGETPQATQGRHHGEREPGELGRTLALGAARHPDGMAAGPRRFTGRAHFRNVTALAGRDGRADHEFFFGSRFSSMIEDANGGISSNTNITQ